MLIKRKNRLNFVRKKNFPFIYTAIISGFPVHWNIPWFRGFEVIILAVIFTEIFNQSGFITMIHVKEHDSHPRAKRKKYPRENEN